MDFDAQLLSVVIGFMVLANRLVEALVTPIFDKFELNKFWLMYIAWGVAGVFVGLAGVNLFADIMPNEIVGLNILHNLVDQE